MHIDTDNSILSFRLSLRADKYNATPFTGFHSGVSEMCNIENFKT